MAMKLHTGKVAFPIEFDNGDKDCIYFNPNDPDLGARLIASRDKIQSRIDTMEFEDFEISNSGEPIVGEINNATDLSAEQIEALTKTAEKVSKIMNDTKNIVCEELDTAFGSEVSKVVFKHCSPFAVVNGSYFIINFLETIAPEIQKYLKKSNAEFEKKMGKHIDKYRK